VRTRLREAKDRLGDAELAVGNFYRSIRNYVAAEDRYRTVLKTDPEYTRKDSLYFFLGETLERYGIPEKKREALPFYERLVTEFEQSEHLEEARRRIDRLKLELKVEPAPETVAR
jgi:outer membrane protein assembly factor BamD (BamD/ComL family)